MMNNDYYLCFTSKDCTNLIKETIIKAEESIDIEAFYFREEGVGLEILNLLIDKAKEGLKIRLILDHLGSYALSNSNILKVLLESNVKIKFFNSILPFSKNQKSLWFLRDHRRTILIDNKQLLTGSFCIGGPTNNWIEIGILIKDELNINKARRVFNKTWVKTHGKTFNIGSVNKKDMSDTNDFNYITQSPLQLRKYIYKYYVRSIKNSSESIYIVVPYFMPNQRFIRRLIKASKRQVSVNLILSEETDVKILDLARNACIKNLLDNGINIYFSKYMIHSKFTIFDNKEAFIGTMNLDSRSINYNYECGLKILNPECIKSLNTYIKDFLIKNSTKIELNSWNQRSLWLKTKERFFWFFRSIL